MTMNHFIKRSVFFIGLILAFFGFNFASNTALFHYGRLPIKKAHVLIAGDSHLQRSLNPRYFNSAVNVSQPAEPMVLTYWKLKYLFNKASFDTLLLGFAHHNISAYNDQKLYSHAWAYEMFRRTYAIQDIESVDGLRIDRNQLYLAYFRNMCLFPHTNHFNFIGGYVNSNKSQVTDAQVTAQRRYYVEETELGVSETTVWCVDSIIRLCRTHGVVPVLISTPVHSSYFKLIPEAIMKRYSMEKERLVGEEIAVYDLTESFYDDVFYLNADHLNAKGASDFTVEFIGLLNGRQRKARTNRMD